jgi:hypothetical protein
LRTIPTLRQSVQKALNRAESYHRLRRAIAYVNFGKLRVKTEAEQCSRLTANAIIYYNTLLRSRVYEAKTGGGASRSTWASPNLMPLAQQRTRILHQSLSDIVSSANDIGAR